MASVQDTVQEIPPPDLLPPEPKKWALPVALLALVVGVTGFAVVTSPEVPAIEWTHLPMPGSVNLDSLVATDNGFAMLSGMTSEGILLWSLDVATGWRSQALTGAPSQLAPAGSSLVAYGIREGKIMEQRGSGWEDTLSLSFPAEVRSRQASGRPSLIGAPDGLVAISLLGDVYWTSDGAEFAKVVADPRWGPGVERPFDPACQPPSRSSPDIPPLVEAGNGFVAMVSGNPDEPFGIWPACEPRVWVSADGRTWTETDSIIGEGAYVYDLAWKDGRFTAVGGFGIGEPAAWTSEDGLSWELIPQLSFGLDVDLFTVEAGPAGWVVLGQNALTPGYVGWTSFDGICWDSLPKHVKGSDAAVSDSHLLLMERNTFPEFWLGTVSPERASCG
jgi:hypothetical protein